MTREELNEEIAWRRVLRSETSLHSRIGYQHHSRKTQRLIWLEKIADGTHPKPVAAVEWSPATENRHKNLPTTNCSTCCVSR